MRRRALTHDFAFLEHDHTVAHRGQVVHAVRHHDDRRALLVQLGNELQELAGRGTHGSRPATGSSSTSASGFMASTPAKATRRCWPPESSKGLMSRRLSMERPTRESDSRTRASTSSPERPRLRGPNATSSNTVVANTWRLRGIGIRCRCALSPPLQLFCRPNLRRPRARAHG